MRRISCFHLLEAPGILSQRSALVAVPEAVNQFHQQMAVDAMALLDRLVRNFRSILTEIDADDVAQLFVPVLFDRILLGEARWRSRLCHCRRQRCTPKGACRASRLGRFDEKVAPVDVVELAHLDCSVSFR